MLIALGPQYLNNWVILQQPPYCWLFTSLASCMQLLYPPQLLHCEGFISGLLQERKLLGEGVVFSIYSKCHLFVHTLFRGTVSIQPHPRLMYGGCCACWSHPMDTADIAVPSQSRGSGGPRQSHVTDGYVSSPHHHLPLVRPHDSPPDHYLPEGASSGPPSEVSISEASSWVLNGRRNDREG